MTDDRPTTMKALYERAGEHMRAIRAMIPGNTRMTLVVRHLDQPDDTASLLLSDDDPATAVRTIETLLRKGTRANAETVEPEVEPEAGTPEMGPPLAELSFDTLQFMAERIDETMNGDAVDAPGNKPWAFILMTFGFTGPGATPVFHISNADRETSIHAMRAWLAQAEAENDPGSDAALRSATPAGRA
jgi:hypothetical protein